jgi:hypothetical protein
MKEIRRYVVATMASGCVCVLYFWQNGVCVFSYCESFDGLVNASQTNGREGVKYVDSFRLVQSVW